MDNGNNGNNPLYSRAWSGIVTGSQVPISNPFSILQNLDESNNLNNQSVLNQGNNGKKPIRTKNVDTRMSPIHTPTPTPAPSIISANQVAPNSTTESVIEDFEMDQGENDDNINDLLLIKFH